MAIWRFNYAVLSRIWILTKWRVFCANFMGEQMCLCYFSRFLQVCLTWQYQILFLFFVFCLLVFLPGIELPRASAAENREIEVKKINIPCGNSPAIWVVRLAFQGTRTLGYLQHYRLCIFVKKILAFFYRYTEMCNDKEEVCGDKEAYVERMRQGVSRESGMGCLPSLSCLDKATLNKGILCLDKSG